MSLTSALSVARSGLSASARAAEITSQNVANALTEGYGKRSLTLSALSTGGVAVTGTARFEDRALTGDRRVAEAGSAAAGLAADALQRIEDAIGTPDSEGSVGALISGVETALITAAANLQSEAGLGAAVDAADRLAARMNAIGDEIQTMREGAETAIATSVDQINTSLRQIADLNTRIAAGAADATALMDQRQVLVDGIAAEVPLREVDRGNGQIALYSTTGVALLDGSAAVLGFTKATAISADSAALSGLTVNGRAVAGLGDGALAAQFAIRDTIAPEAQAALDVVAADLIARTSGSGLFQTTGSGVAVAAEVKAEPWRLRDGLAAVAEGDAGDATRLNALASAMSEASSATLLSTISTARVAAEAEASFTSARYDALRSAELEGAVDTDAEMQSLLVIEQAYAANAKVIQAVDQMMQTLLGI